MLPTRIYLQSRGSDYADSLEYGRSLGQSVTGGFVYRGSRYPALRGFYLYGDFGSGNLWAVQPQGAGWDNRLLQGTGRSISSFGEDGSGELYLADYQGQIYLITAGPPSTTAAGVVKRRQLRRGYLTGLAGDRLRGRDHHFSGDPPGDSIPDSHDFEWFVDHPQRNCSAHSWRRRGERAGAD